MNPSRIQDMACIGALALLALLLVQPYWGGAAVPVDLTHARTLEPWMQDGAAPHSDALSRLHTTETYPLMTHLAAGPALEQMLWHPDDGVGAPVMARWRTRALSPFTLPVYFLPLGLAWPISLALKILVAGIAAFYTARRFGLEPPLALASASAYAFSAPVLLWGAEPLGDAAPWFPLLMLAGERMALGQPRTWPMAAILLALIGLGGHPPVLYGSFAALAGYVILRRAITHEGTRWLLVAPLLGFAGGSALLLLLVQLWPYAEYLGQSDGGAFTAPAPRHAWQGLLSPLLPANTAEHHGLWASLLYVGPVAILLAPLWWVVRPLMEEALRHRTDALGLSATASLLLTCLASLVLPASYAPQWLSPAALALLPPLAAGYVVAAIAEEWLILTADEVREVIRRLKVLLPVIWVVWLVLVIALCFQGTPFMFRVLLVSVGTMLAVLLLFGFTLIRPNALLLGYGTALITAAALALSLSPLRPYTAAEDIFPDSPYAQALTGSIGQRVSGSETLGRWPLAVAGLSQVPAPNAAGLTRATEFEARLGEDPLLVRRTGAEALLLSKEDIQGDMAGLRPWLRIEEVFAQGAVLFRDTELRPRARVIYRGQRASANDASQVDSEAPPVLEGASLPRDGSESITGASITQESSTEITIQIPETGAGVLVLADTWYPGWWAYNEGVPGYVFPVDHLFRGVEIGEGEQTLTLRYEPSSFRYGLIASLITLIALIAVQFRPRREQS